ncbi:MAG: sensor histidine kinase, partial [Bacillota bacterium]|nr:sensor histidine kinase [Bacillota bacterium]
IAMVHDVFACQTCDTVDLRELSQRILKGLLESSVLPEQTIETQITGQSVLLSSSQAVPLALVINELLTNSFKHGIKCLDKGLIILKLAENEGQIQLSVWDNGPEPHVPFDSIKQRRLGLQIVDSLVSDQLGGKFDMNRIEGMTCVTVCFPKDNSEELS